MSAPLVSVIMPVYNVGSFIDQAIASVLAQDVDLELIVVNDGSTDDTGARARAVTDPRVRVLDQPNSGRPSIARNRGMREARGRYLAFLDGDDVFLPGRMLRVIGVFEARPDLDVVFHDANHMDERGTMKGSYLHGHTFPAQARDYLTSVGGGVYVGSERFAAYISAFFSPFLMSAITLRRSVLDAEPVWFREDMRCGEDVDLWFRLAPRSRIGYIDETLSAYRFRVDSTTRDTRDYLRGTLQAHVANLERMSPALTEPERRRYIHRIADRYLHLAYQERLAGRPGEARANCRRSFSWRPSLQSVTLYLKTFLPRRRDQSRAS